jgi:hypothetical protein
LTAYVEVALGTSNKLRQEVSAAVAEAVRQATAGACAQAVVNADETGWVPGNSEDTKPQRRKVWL